MSYSNEDHRNYPADEQKYLDSCHAVYTDVLKYLAYACRKNDVLLDEQDFLNIMQHVGDAVCTKAEGAVDRINYEGGDVSTLPDNNERLAEVAYKQLEASFNCFASPLDIKAILSGVQEFRA